MRTQASASTGTGGWVHVRRKTRPCRGCGTPITRFAHDTNAPLFCPTCVDRPEDPVAAEPLRDLGGNE